MKNISDMSSPEYSKICLYVLWFSTIDAIDVPMPPKGPMGISHITQSSVQLEWWPPDDTGGGPIIGYWIDAREIGNIDIIW